MDEPRLNYSGINYSGRSLHDIIKTQEDIINQLKGTIKVFEKNVEKKTKNYQIMILFLLNTIVF